jgi:hypothetical protein
MLQIEWPFACMSTEDWATRMSQDTEWGDDVFLSLAYHLLNRRIIILSLDRPTSTDLKEELSLVQILPGTFQPYIFYILLKQLCTHLIISQLGQLLSQQVLLLTLLLQLLLMSLQVLLPLMSLQVLLTIKEID